MAFNGSGTYNLYTPGNPVVTGTTISSSWANNTLSDIATGLTDCITKDGQTTTTVAIPFAHGISIPTGQSVTGAGTATITGFNSVSCGSLTSTTANAGGLTQETATAASGLLQNSWVDFGGAFRASSFWKDSQGVVHLQGAIKSGTTTAGTTIFTLPSGYRPPSTVILCTISSGGTVWEVDINSSGVVAVGSAPNNAYASLEGLSFRT